VAQVSKYAQLLQDLWETATTLSVELRRQYFDGALNPNDMKAFLAILTELYAQLRPKIRGTPVEESWKKWDQRKILLAPEKVFVDGDRVDAEGLWQLYMDIREALEVLGITRIEVEEDAEV